MLTLASNSNFSDINCTPLQMIFRFLHLILSLETVSAFSMGPVLGRRVSALASRGRTLAWKQSHSIALARETLKLENSPSVSGFLNVLYEARIK